MLKTNEWPFLSEMEGLAHAAQRQELAVRDSIARQLQRCERERQFAFRRLELARTMAAAVTGASDEETAVLRQQQALSAELGWHAETELRDKALEAWRPVAMAVWTALGGTNGEAASTAVADIAPGESDTPSVHRAMLAFEAWYEVETGQPFLAILDHEIPEIPVVEF